MDPLKLSQAEVEQLPEGQALEVLAAHVKAKQHQLVEALTGSSSKGLARAAKKALYQLKSSGVAIKDKAPVGEALTLDTTAVVFPALWSPVLGTGERAVLFARAHRGPGLELFQGILHDELGIQQLDRAEVSRGAYRKHLRGIHERQNVVEVPLSRMLEELGRAWGQNLRAKTPLAQATADNLRVLGVKLDETLPTMPPLEPGDEALAATSAALHDEPEIKAWLPPEAQIALLAQQLDALKASKAEPAALLEPARKLAGEFFVGKLRPLYAWRLWAMAEFFELSGRPGPAKLARAEARTLFHHPTAIGGFGLKLYEKVIALSL